MMTIYIYIYYHNNLCIMYLDMHTHRGEAQDGDDKYVLVHINEDEEWYIWHRLVRRLLCVFLSILNYYI